MSYYGAVAAVRIQSWIARTPDLRLVRGASEALIAVTSRAGLAETITLPEGVRLDTDTPEVDGVCTLVSDDAATLDEAIVGLLNHLQAQLPGVEWSAWRAQAASYVAAYDQVQHAPDAPDSDVRQWPNRLPLLLDLPFAAACSTCPHEVAVAEQRNADGEAQGVGPDCQARLAARDTVRKTKVNPRPGQDRPDEFATFDGLAAVGRLGWTAGRRNAANHLATICADGNRVGDFFASVARLHEPTLQQKLSHALSEAMTNAAHQAARCGPEGQLVAINHFVGGDDIFSSVAAPFAWQYAVTLAHTFTADFQSAVSEVLPNAESDPTRQAVVTAAERVSLGIGIAFAHASHPLADARDSAQAAEQTAKAAARGNLSGVSWLDLTVEPAASVDRSNSSRHRFVSIADAQAQLDDPGPLLTLGGSARHTLIALLRPDPTDTADAIADRVRRWAVRVGRKDDLEPALPLPGSAAGDEMLDTLRTTLDRGRWWPVANPNERTEDVA